MRPVPWGDWWRKRGQGIMNRIPAEQKNYLLTMNPDMKD
jgi:hypothetical protein